MIETWEMPFPKCPHKDDIGEVSLKKCREQRNMSPEGLPTWICLKCSKVKCDLPKLLSRLRFSGLRYDISGSYFFLFSLYPKAGFFDKKPWKHSAGAHQVKIVKLAAQILRQGRPTANSSHFNRCKHCPEGIFLLHLYV